MPATRDGKMWRSQFYYKDWQGVSHKKNKRGFRTREALEQKRKQNSGNEISFSNSSAIWTSILKTLFRFITKIWNTDCVKIP